VVGLVGDEQRRHRLRAPAVHSRAGGDVTLQLPWKTGSGGRVTFPTVAGRTYNITPKGRWEER